MDNPAHGLLLPITVRQVLAGGLNPLDAVVLFADLAGYSRFCADLIEGDARGAEAVGRMLNRLTQQFADTINSHGGSVLAFAGDATMALWPLSSAACRQALACADGLHAAAAAAMAKQPLPLKICIDAGRLTIADIGLGDAGRRVLAQGEAIDRIGSSVASVAPGKTGVSNSFLAALADPALPPSSRAETIRQLNGPFEATRAVVPVAPACDATPYIAAPIVRLLTGSTRDWLAEFRRATILFVTLPVLPESQIPAVLEKLAVPIAATNGVVLQILTDDKGLVLLAVWGLATNTHADDASRAVMAASGMQPMLREVGGGAGIAGGKVWTGLLGGAAEQQYAVVGDPVNRASALSRAARGELRIDKLTADAVAGRFDLRPAAPIRTKGDAKPQPVFCDPVEKSATSHTGSAMVGRTAEIAAVLQHLSHPGAVVTLHGEAGIGKSRLTAYLRQEIVQRGQPLRIATADSLRRSTAFHIWPPIFAGLLEKTPVSSLEQHPPLAGRLALLNPVLAEDQPETAELQRLDPATRGAVGREAIAEAAAQLWPDPPGVLVIEDAHWLDSASWLVLTDLRRKRPELSLLLVTRGNDTATLPREAVALLGQPEAVTVALGPLSIDETASLAATTLGVQHLPPALVARIHARAEGHPLFTAELARSLRDRGIVQTASGRATVRLDERGIEAIVFPDGLDSVIAERIATLDPAVQLTVKAAAVLGRRFTAPALTAIRPGAGGTSATDAHLGAITATGLIETEGEDGFRFHHALIQETAHTLLLREQRIELHAAAARWLESDSQASAEQLPVIAQHWSAAEDHDRAMDRYDRAATQARATGAQAEVVEFIARALDHAGKATTAPAKQRVGRWHYLSGNALRELGYYRRGLDELRRAIGLLDRPMPVSTAGNLVRCVSEFARLKLPRRKVATQSRDDALLVASAMHRLSEISYEHDEIPQTLAGLLAGLNKAERAGGDSPELARLLMGAAFAGMAAPWAIDSLAYRDRSLAIAERLDDPALWSWVLFIAANLDFGRGEFESARGYLVRGVPICDQAGEIKNWYSTVATLGNVLRVEGRLTEGHTQDEILLERALDRGMVLAEVWAITALAKGNVLLNRFDELDACIERMDAIFADPANVREGSTDNYMTVHLARAGSHIGAGRYDEALASLEETVRLLATVKSPAVFGMEPVTMVSDMVAFLARNGFASERLLPVQKTIVAYAKKLAAPYAAARGKLLLALGDLEVLNGRPEKARQSWEKAQTAAQERRTPYDEAGAWQRLGNPRAGEILASLGVPRPIIWD